MDRFRKDFSSSTSFKPNSVIHGNDENELSEELAFKLKISDKKRSPRKQISAKRNKTLDLQEQPRLSRSYSFDSNASRLCVMDGELVGNNSLVVGSDLQAYDPYKNYLSPRPKFLKYSPDRHLEIIARQENVNRLIKSASFDCGMPFSEEVESSVDSSVEDSGEIIDEFVGNSENELKHEEEDDHNDDTEKEDHNNDNEEDEEAFDDFEGDNGGSLNMFVQFLFVIIALILITWSISFMNSPTHLPARDAKREELAGEAIDLMMLIVGNFSNSEIDNVHVKCDKKDLVVNTGESVEMQLERIKGFCKYEVEDLSKGKDEVEELYFTETGEVENDIIDVEYDEFDEIKEVEVEELEDEEEISYQLQDSVISTSIETVTHEIEPVKETYSLLNDIPEIVNSNNDGQDENEIEGIKTNTRTSNLVNLANLGPKFAAFIGISVLILVTLSVLCCSKKMKASSPITYTNRSNKNKVTKESSYIHGKGEVTGSYINFGSKRSIFAESQECNFSQSHGNNYVSLIHSNASSSSKTKFSNYEMSTGDSPSIGSFTVEKKIVKKQKSKTPEVMISTVRRSSRIHNRSIMSSPTSLNASC